ncbi:MAG: ABC transporter A family member 7, partial [Trebouxia sp. A1-2]
MLFTGEDESTATALAGYLFVQQTLTAADLTDPVATFQSQAAQGVFYGELFGELGLVLGTSLDPVTTYFIEPAFVNSTANCNQTSSVLTFGEYSQAWDFRNTVAGQLQVDAYYNASKDPNAGNASPLAVRVNQGLNLATNAFLRWSLGAQYSAKLLAIMEMPKQETHLSLDFSSLLGPIFYCWLSQLLLPLLLVTLVYEKQHRLRIMMKMHGLGDSAYWIIQYTWFLFIYCCYIAILLLVGSAINLKFFRLTNYGLQIIFFFVWGNCLIAFAFLASIFFTNAKTANVVAFLWVFGTGLLNNLLMENYYKDHHSWVYVVELIPSFALYRALYEQAAYAFKATYQNGGHGLNFSDLHDYNNHWIYATCVCAVETVLAVVLAWYLEQVLASGTGVRRHPLFFLQRRKSKGGSGERAPKLNRPWFGWLHRQGHAHSQAMPPNKVVKVAPSDTVVTGHAVRMVGPSALGNGLQYKLPDRGLTTPEASNLEPAAAVQDPEVALNMESADVQAERERVSTMTNFENECIVMRDLRKVYPSQDGNPEKQAVRNLTMAVERGECFGLLGPNGAGKTSAINMLVGLMEPSSGTATVEGLDIRSDMADIYAMMGVCPQHDLLWETLTGREHLLFYGRLKNLKGLQLQDAVMAALRSVNLLNGGVGNKQVQTYSGGMKRRLSVAISLMGNPAVVYLDEPSTVRNTLSPGLDPASRRNLWDVVKAAKRNRGIILTTHSMQEAEVLCDRLGIFVDGQLVCIGNPKELTARYGGYVVCHPSSCCSIFTPICATYSRYTLLQIGRCGRCHCAMCRQPLML